MKSFQEKTIPALPLTHDIMRSVAQLHEYRGREDLYAQQSRQALDTLREVAVVRSAESSNRIEGVEAAPDRLKKLMEENTAPQTRSEQAIAGYRDVLDTIHSRHEDISLSSAVVRQFHRDLFKYTSSRGATGNQQATTSLRSTQMGPRSCGSRRKRPNGSSAYSRTNAAKSARVTIPTRPTTR